MLQVIKEDRILFTFLKDRSGFCVEMDCTGQDWRMGCPLGTPIVTVQVRGWTGIRVVRRDGGDRLAVCFCGPKSESLHMCSVVSVLQISTLIVLVMVHVFCLEVWR